MANEATEEKREYDQAGRLLATTDKYSGRIAYSYDLLGNRIAMVDPDGGEFSYEYDAENHLTTFTDPEGQVTSYSYDVMGRVISTSFPNQTATINSYNEDNRLATTVTSSDRDGILASFAYSYDAVGNKLSMTEEDGGLTSYQYDAAYRLIRVDYPERAKQTATTAKNNCSDKGKGRKKGHIQSEENLQPATVSYV
jgi:YD repeat-containing protein